MHQGVMDRPAHPQRAGAGGGEGGGESVCEVVIENERGPNSLNLVGALFLSCLEFCLVLDSQNGH